MNEDFLTLLRLVGPKGNPILLSFRCTVNHNSKENECREHYSQRSCHLDSGNGVTEHISLINNILSANVPDSESL